MSAGAPKTWSKRPFEDSTTCLRRIKSNGLHWSAILDVKPTANLAEIQAAYKRAAMKAHQAGRGDDKLVRVNLAIEAVPGESSGGLN